VLLITLIRGVIGIIMKGLSSALSPERTGPATAPHPRPNTDGFGGELVKDPVCGMFISPATAQKKVVQGETHYFCSPECRDKFNV
jgi:YHS domain-containing protein